MIFMETDRLILRNVEPFDIDELYDYRNNIACSKYQRGQKRNYDDLVNLINERHNDTLELDSSKMIAVALKETNRLIGEIKIMPNLDTITLGYTFSYKIHRQGFAFEALSKLISYLHETYPTWDFVCFVDTNNIASKKLLEKLGYKKLGFLRSKNSEVFGKWLRETTKEELLKALQ